MIDIEVAKCNGEAVVWQNEKEDPVHDVADVLDVERGDPENADDYDGYGTCKGRRILNSKNVRNAI